MYNWFPDKIPISDLKTDTDEDKIYNCELAFKVAEEAGINKYLDGEDMVVVQDKKSIMLYLSEIFGIVNDMPVKWSPSEEWLANQERKMLADNRAKMERGLGSSTPPIKAQSIQVTRTFKVGGLTPSGGGGSLWSSRQDEEAVSPRGQAEVKKNLTNLEGDEKKATEETKGTEGERESPSPAVRSATVVPKKGTGSLWANRTGQPAETKTEPQKTPASKTLTTPGPRKEVPPATDKEPEKEPAAADDKPVPQTVSNPSIKFNKGPAPVKPVAQETPKTTAPAPSTAKKLSTSANTGDKEAKPIESKPAV